MSALLCEKTYQHALADLTAVQREDAQVTRMRVASDAATRNTFMQSHWLPIYLRYLHVARRLSWVHEVKLQPQQLHDVRTLLDTCLARMLEVKAQLTQYCGDALPLDDALLDARMSPHDVEEVLLPRYVLADRAEELAQQRSALAVLQARIVASDATAPVSIAMRCYGSSGSSSHHATGGGDALPLVQRDPTKASQLAAAAAATADTTSDAAAATTREPHMHDDISDDVGELPMSLEEAVRVLQVCERGRQARQRARFQLALYKQRQYAATHARAFSTITGKDRAATVVQKAVLGYLERKRAAQRYAQELRFCGLVAPDALQRGCAAARATAAARAAACRARQCMNVAELRQQTLDMEAKLKTRDGAKTMEEMLDEVLLHMSYARLESKDGELVIVELPPPEEGGSLKLLGRVAHGGAGATAALADDAAATAASSRKGGALPRKSSQRLRSRSMAGAALADVATPTSIATPVTAVASPFAPPTVTANGGGGGASERGRAPSRTNSSSSSAAAYRPGSAGGGGGDGASAAASILPTSALWPLLSDGVERYQTMWRGHFAQTYLARGDLDQAADMATLRQQLLEGPRGVMAELRRCVDGLVLIEVNNLKARLEQERAAARGAGRRRGRKGDDGGSAARKATNKKKKKQPKLRDPSKGVDVEALLQAAVYEHTLQLPPTHIHLADFVGDESVVACALHDLVARAHAPDEELKRRWQRVLRGWDDDVAAAMHMSRDAFERELTAYASPNNNNNNNNNTPVATSSLQQQPYAPSAAALRRAMAEYAVLPLGSQVIHDLAPRVSALLLYGFAGTGKTMLTYALCNDAGATFLNVSPDNFASVKGIAKTVRGVFALARLRAPAVIYVDHIEHVFAGRRVGKSKKEPLYVRGRKLRKELVKGMATLQPTDRVLLVGTCTQPWLADAAALATTFRRALHTPVPDAATRLQLLQHFVRAIAPDTLRRVAGDDDNDDGDNATTAAARSSSTSAPAASDATPSHASPPVTTTTTTPYATTMRALRLVSGLCDGLTAGQLRDVVRRTLHPHRVERLAQRPLDADDFLPALSRTQRVAAADVELMTRFHAQLPLHMRRAIPSHDFARRHDDDDEGKKKPGGAGGKKASKA